MFGKKKILKRNESNRELILNTITALQNRCRDDKVGQQLTDAKEQVALQPSTPSYKAITYDAPILKYLQAVEGDLRNGHFAAEVRMELVQEKLTARKQDNDVISDNPLMSKQARKEEARRQKEMKKYYKKNPTLYADELGEEKLYPENIGRKLKWAKLKDEEEQYTAQLVELKEQMVQTQDRSLATQFQLIKAKLNGVQNSLKSIGMADLKDVNYQAISNELDLGKELERESAYTNEDAKVKMEQLENLRKAQASDPLLEQMQKMNSGNDVGGIGTASASAGGTTATGDPELDALFADMDRAAEVDKIKKAKPQKEKEIQDLLQQLEEKQIKAKEIAAQAKGLLEQREGWSASEREFGDAKIEVLQSDFNANQHEAEVIRGLLAQRLDQLNILRQKLSAEVAQELAVTSTGIDYGKLAEQAIASFDAMNKKTADLAEHVGALRDVKIQTGAASAIPPAESEGAADDNKFATFKAQIAAY